MQTKFKAKPDNLKGFIKYTKKERGITLIALIIMVVLIIILASIGIKGLTGKENIIASSSKIANEYIVVQAKEYVEGLARSIILKDILKGEETTVKSLATEMEKDENIISAVPDEETGTILVTTKEGVIVIVYYDEETGELRVDPIGENDKLAIPRVKARYNKESSTIQAEVTCQDGIESIELIYKGDSKETILGKGAKEYTANFKEIRQAGTYTIKAISSKGKVGYAYVHVQDKIASLKAPTIEIVSGIEGDNNWYKGEVSLRIKANETGGTKLKYRIVGQTNVEEGNNTQGEQTAEGLSQDLTIRDIGLTRIVAWVTNEDETKTSEYAYQNIKIDNIAPNNVAIQVIEGQVGNQVVGQTNQNWYITDVKLKITATDENSGIAGYEYTVTNTYTNKIIINKETLKGQEKEISIKADGIYKIEIIAIDRAGNRSSTTTTTIYKDSTAPNEFMPTIARESAKGFTIIAYTDDNLSGIDKYKYYVDDNMVYEGVNRQYNYEGKEDTTYGIKVEAYDKAGNIRKGMSTGASTEPEDSTPPVVIVTKGDVTTNSIQVFVTATDQGTGLASEPEYTYYIKKSSETEYKKVAENMKDTTYVYTGLEQATEYDIKVEVTDGAGNVGSGAIRVITTGKVPGGDTAGILEITEPVWNNLTAKVTVSTNQTEYELQYKVVKSGQTESQVKWETLAEGQTSKEITGLLHGDKVEIRLSDGINGGEAKYKEILDDTKPEITITTTNIQNSVTFKATDTKSGIVGYKVTKEKEEPTEGWTNVTKTLSLGETTVSNLDYNTAYYIWIKDAAGNTNSKSIKTKSEFTVTYDYATNGGASATVTTKQVTVGQAVDLTPTATKSGWNFVGWNTNKDAETVLNTLTMPANDVTLYAIFSKDIIVTYYTYNNQTKKVIVKLNNNQTSGQVTHPAIANVTESGVTYTPRGWSTGTSANGAVTAAGTTINVTTNLNIYASYQATITSTFYYNSNKTAGNFTSANTTATGIRYMNYAGTKVESNLTIPTAVTGSIGKYNSAYKGVANAVNTMAVVTPTTANTTYYTTYSSQVKIYYPASLSTASNYTKYRNERFTGTTGMRSSISDNNNSIVDFTFTSSVSGYTLSRI